MITPLRQGTTLCPPLPRRRALPMSGVHHPLETSRTLDLVIDPYGFVIYEGYCVTSLATHNGESPSPQLG
jgi:hypothetical protein